MDDLSDYMDRYFNDELTPSEKELFEKRCLSDTAFARELAMYITINDHLKFQWYEHKKEQLDALENEAKSLENEDENGRELDFSTTKTFKQRKDKGSRAKFLLRFAVAAAITGVVAFAAAAILYLKKDRNDLRILQYQPTRPQIENLEGVYMVYTGSPQVKKSDPNRYHMVVPHILKVRYKGEGYFEFSRYGPIISHTGYMQFEGPNLVAIHTDVSYADTIFPKYSLLELRAGKDTFNVMSVSWSWDTSKNVMIGIREVYIKIGKNGSIKPVLVFGRSTGKFEWTKENGQIDTILLQNVRLETLPKSIQPLLDENSIIAKDPDSTLILKKDP